jgi:hypothetical protein
MNRLGLDRCLRQGLYGSQDRREGLFGRRSMQGVFAYDYRRAFVASFVTEARLDIDRVRNASGFHLGNEFSQKGLCATDVAARSHADLNGKGSSISPFDEV